MPTVLLADDDRGVREALSDLLELAGGHAVLRARDGAEALALLETGGPVDVVVSDVVMPRLDGYGLAEAVRARGDGTPIVLMSAATHPVCALPGVACLSKPFDADALLALVDELAGSAGPG